MKKNETKTLLHAAALLRAEKDTPAARLYGDLRGDLSSWHRQRVEDHHSRRLYLLTAGTALLLLSGTYRFAPSAAYRLSDGSSYDVAAAATYKTLGR